MSITTASQGGTHLTYHVEVRSLTGVSQLGERSYGSDWVRYVPDRWCVPPSALQWMDRHFGLMTYPEAMAVAWMVTAYVDSYTDMQAMGLEARVVESRVEYQYQARQVRTFAPIAYHAQPPAPEPAPTTGEGAE